MFLKIIIFCLSYQIVHSQNTYDKLSNQCDADVETCLIEENKNRNQYEKEQNQYLAAINDALNTFKPCVVDNCGCHSERITNDLKPFQNGISKDMLDSIRDRGVKYQIIDHRLYRQKDCLFPSRCTGIEHFINGHLAHLDNMEMIINCRDWPQIHKQWQLFGPVFSFSKTTDYLDIMYPAWSFWAGGPAISLYPTGLGRWDLHRKSVNTAGTNNAWEQKLTKAFFRGSRTSDERDNLILLARKMPNMIDAQYTKNQAWKSPQDTLMAEPAKEVSLEHHCKYKFLFNYRGVAASFRLKHLFLCKSLVFHVGDEWLEFFYDSLKPWVHYVPVPSNASQDDLMKLIQFFQDHDDIAKSIAQRGYEHIWSTLRMDDVNCYWHRLLNEYSKLIMFNVTLDHSLLLV